MNAIKFIKEHSVEKAREVVEGAPDWASEYCTDCKDYVNYDDSCYDGFSECESCVSVNNLKRLVESVERINSCGGLHGFKTYCNGDYSERDSQAIADYEQLFGNTETLELETLRDCDTSPNCKKFDERVK